MLVKHQRKSFSLQHSVKYFALALFLSLLVPSSNLWPQTQQEKEALQLSLAKAYLYIASYASWPKGALNNDSFVFCINRSHHLFDVLSKYLPGRKIQGLPIELRFFEESDATGQRACNIIALSDNEKGNKKIVTIVTGQPVLTMSDESDISSFGGLVYLAHDDKIMPPKINFDTLKASGLTIDANILAISARKWGNMPNQ